MYIPHEKLTIDWSDTKDSFKLSLPWLSMDIDVEKEDKAWLQEATHYLQLSATNDNVQKFMEGLKDYPVFYVQPRQLKEFKEKDLQPCLDISIDPSTPAQLIATFGCDIADELKESALPAWTWDQKKILSKALIPGTDLYDPISLISYLICYRLEWESTSWTGQDGLGQFLEKLLNRNEDEFFQAIGWISKQSWYVTSTAWHGMEPALIHFPKAHDLLEHYIHDEIGHHKFMEQVFEDINLNKEDFPVSEGTKWLLASHERAAEVSPLQFSAMLNIFEAAFYEGQDPISRVIKLSSKPHAAQGYDLHYKINQEHRHCDMPLLLAKYLAPQTYAHAASTLGLFELTLNFLDKIEKNLAQTFNE